MEGGAALGDLTWANACAAVERGRDCDDTADAVASVVAGMSPETIAATAVTAFAAATNVVRASVSSRSIATTAALVLAAAALGGDTRARAGAYFVRDDKTAAAAAAKLWGGAWEHEPDTLTSALRQPWAPQWQAAADDEMRSIDENRTYDLVDVSKVPAGVSVLGTRMFGKCKRAPDGTVSRWKMRMICQGHKAVQDIHYYFSSAPIPSAAAWRLFLAVAAVCDLDIAQYDIKCAFLTADIDSPNCYIRLPPQYRQYRYPDGVVRPEPSYVDSDGVTSKGVEQVGHLRKCLYGLPSAMALFLKK